MKLKILAKKLKELAKKMKEGTEQMYVLYHKKHFGKMESGINKFGFHLNGRLEILELDVEKLSGFQLNTHEAFLDAKYLYY